MNALSKIKDFSSALDTGDCNLSELGAPTGRLNWRARVWLDLMRVIGWPELQDRTVAQARDDLRLLIAATSIWQPIAHARDASIPGPAGDIPIRIYTPLIGTKPRPLLVWFHGGESIGCSRYFRRLSPGARARVPGSIGRRVRGRALGHAERFRAGLRFNAGCGRRRVGRSDPQRPCIPTMPR